jgi:hypothetical protein
MRATDAAARKVDAGALVMDKKAPVRSPGRGLIIGMIEDMAQASRVEEIGRDLAGPQLSVVTPAVVPTVPAEAMMAMEMAPAPAVAMTPAPAVTVIAATAPVTKHPADPRHMTMVIDRALPAIKMPAMNPLDGAGAFGFIFNDGRRRGRGRLG